MLVHSAWISPPHAQQWLSCCAPVTRPNWKNKYCKKLRSTSLFEAAIWDLDPSLEHSHVTESHPMRNASPNDNCLKCVYKALISSEKVCTVYKSTTQPCIEGTYFSKRRKPGVTLRVAAISPSINQRKPSPGKSIYPMYPRNFRNSGLSRASHVLA